MPIPRFYQHMCDSTYKAKLPGRLNALRLMGELRPCQISAPTDVQAHYKLTQTQENLVSSQYILT